MEIGLHLAVLKVRLGSPATDERPETEALVPAFACGENYQSALTFAVAELRTLGDELLDLQGEVQQLDPREWDNYISKVWPEFRHELPTQDQVLERLVSGQVYFGPFIAYAGTEPARQVG